MQKPTFPQKITIVDVSGHPKQYADHKETLEYSGVV